MLNKLCISTLVLFSLNSNAEIITYYDYSLDTETNIVTGGGLEWLQWDETNFMSINQALSFYSDNGWQLATNEEMAAAFNAFGLGLYSPIDPIASGSSITFDADESTSQQSEGYYDRDCRCNPLVEQFFSIFGGVAAPSWTGAYFGEDANGNSLYNIAQVYSDPLVTSPDDMVIYLSADIATSDDIFPEYGVALVRISEVPVPAAVWLFGSGLIGLIGIARRKKA